jgi:hypothetical protein
MNGSERRAGGPALEATYRFLLWLIPTIEKFPKRQKYLLGDRIQTTALTVLESLIEATYTKGRSGMLAQANLRIETLRFLFRLSFDLRLTDQRRYEHASRTLDEIGRLIGGWRKAHAAIDAS